MARDTESQLHQDQILSFFLILLCGGLTLGSVLLTAVNTKFVANQYGNRVFPAWVALAIFKVGAIPVTILSLFLIYSAAAESPRAGAPGATRGDYGRYRARSAEISFSFRVAMDRTEISE